MGAMRRCPMVRARRAVGLRAWCPCQLLQQVVNMQARTLLDGVVDEALFGLFPDPPPSRR